MEKLEVEIPVSVGDKVYRTTSSCEIQAGKVSEIVVASEYYNTNGDNFNKTEVKIVVNYGYCNSVTYKPEELGKKIFPTKESLIKHIVGEL